MWLLKRHICSAGGGAVSLFDVDADNSFVGIKQFPRPFFFVRNLAETRNYLLYSLLHAPTDGNMGVANQDLSPLLRSPLGGVV